MMIIHLMNISIQNMKTQQEITDITCRIRWRVMTEKVKQQHTHMTEQERE